MVSKEEVTAALIAAAAELKVDGDELGGLLFALSKLSELEELKCFPLGNKKAMVAFARSAQGTLGGPSMGATGAGGSADAPDVGRQRDQPGGELPTLNAQARARKIATYFATDALRKRCFTPLLPRILVTYCHGSHADLVVGQDIKVRINDGALDKQRSIKARVLGSYPDLHVLFCSTAEPVDAPDLDASVRAAEPYLVLGCSNTSQQASPFSISHGSISTTTPDILGFIRGDTAAVLGDSGGGCFSAETGKLIAMNVAADKKNGDRAVLIPVSNLLSMLWAHHFKELKTLMPNIDSNWETTVAGLP